MIALFSRQASLIRRCGTPFVMLFLAFMRTVTCIALLIFFVLPFGSAVAAANPLDAWPAATREGPILVRLDDGRTLEAVGPVRVGGTRIILRLTDDSLVSVAATSVKDITQDPVRSRKPEPQQEAPVVITNEDLPPAFPSQAPPNHGGTPPAPTLAPAEASKGEPTGLRPGEHVDRNGHGETWWRERKTRLEEQLAETVADVERLESEVRVAKARAGARTNAMHGRSNRAPYPRRPNQRLSSLEAQKLNEFEDAVEGLEAARERRVELQAELDGLPDEARRANALPGWLR
ncbi:MAG: hypothetical protein GY716_09275 [bacterium]|nr:hypothetical protein [bacterium]